MEPNTSRLISGIKRLKNHPFCPQGSPVPQAVRSPQCNLPVPRTLSSCPDVHSTKLLCFAISTEMLALLMERNAGTLACGCSGAPSPSRLSHPAPPSLTDKSLSPMITGILETVEK